MRNQAEKDFEAIFKGSKIEYPSREQDMFEHWDISVDGLKIDVKGRKKINRRDRDAQDEFHFLEIKNVRGNLGWAYGKADAIAFETKDSWILVKTEEVQKLISRMVEKKWVNSSGESLYKIYQRRGRRDVITMVKVQDLEAVSFRTIRKDEQ